MNSMPFSDLRLTVVIADSSPLIHLAGAGQLDLLFKFGKVVVVDIVRLETSFNQSKPFAPEIAAWISSNVAGGYDARLALADTELGPLYELALEHNRKPPQDSADRAVVDWLSENVVHAGGPALIICECGKIPDMLRREGLPEDVEVMTSRCFLRLAPGKSI